MDRKAAAPAADAPCSNRSILPARGARSSKPAARYCVWHPGGTTENTERSINGTVRPLHVLGKQIIIIIIIAMTMFMVLSS